uniref:Major facilitator superfamily (MFS) profile domain-containing protein n=1 Tax=Panagrolaimus superbus TaxID=310955 RepID=A0A914YUF2_9BILA
MAMICMVNRTAVDALNEKTLSLTPAPTLLNNNESQLLKIIENKGQIDECEIEDLGFIKSRQAMKKAQLAKHYNGNLVIKKPDQALIFTSFYAGGLAIVIPGSYLCDRFGAKNVVLIGAVVNVIGTFLTPFVASTMHAYALVALRFIMGCGQGILVPCMNVLIAHWFPLAEKSTAIAISTTGNQVSVIVAMFLTAELCQINLFGGWPLAFHSYGIIGLGFCIFWVVYVYNSPSKAKNISTDEVLYIQECSHNVGGKKIGANEVPWKAIFTSPTVWATALNSFSQNFMTVGTITYIPSYYQTVLRMDLSANGLMSAFPFIFQLITKIILASSADWLRKNKVMSHNSVTKIYNLIASFGSGICYFLLTFCDCRSSTWAIILVILAIGLSSGFIPGYNTSMVCIAPRYTSSVASFCRLLGQIAAVASPYMIGYIVQKGTKEEWKIAFYVMTIVLFICGAAFQFFGSVTVQEWAKAPSPPTSDNRLQPSDGSANAMLLPEKGLKSIESEKNDIKIEN